MPPPSSPRAPPAPPRHANAASRSPASAAPIRGRAALQHDPRRLPHPPASRQPATPIPRGRRSPGSCGPDAPCRADSRRPARTRMAVGPAAKPDAGPARQATSVSRSGNASSRAIPAAEPGAAGSRSNSRTGISVSSRVALRPKPHNADPASCPRRLLASHLPAARHEPQPRGGSRPGILEPLRQSQRAPHHALHVPGHLRRPRSRPAAAQDRPGGRPRAGAPLPPYPQTAPATIPGGTAPPIARQARRRPSPRPSGPNSPAFPSGPPPGRPHHRRTAPTAQAPDGPAPVPEPESRPPPLFPATGARRSTSS